MKALFIGILALTVALSPALAQTTARTLTMSGQAEVQAAPDTVTLSAGVTSQAATAAAALAANNAQMQTVFAALKKIGVQDKDIQTSNFSISPRMTSGDNQPSRVSRYEVNNEVRVRLDDVAKLGGALDTLVNAGANQMNGISFGIKDSAPLLAEARTDAVADAKAKADIYAKASGVTLGSILSISENGYQAPRPQFLEQAMVSAARSTPVAAGEQSVAAQVSIVWEIH